MMRDYDDHSIGEVQNGVSINLRASSTNISRLTWGKAPTGKLANLFASPPSLKSLILSPQNLILRYFAWRYQPIYYQKLKRADGNLSKRSFDLPNKSK